MLSLCRKVLLGLSLSLLAVANGSLAAPIMLTGDHFTVTYDSVQAGLYKGGLLSGSLDTVFFQPDAFAAISGGAPASTTAELQLTFSIDPGYSFAGLNFTERGDYTRIGNAAVNVVASVQADTSAIDTLNLDSGQSFNQTGGATPWELTGQLTPQGLGVPQTFVVTLDNTLSASASAGSLGFIQKTYAGFRVTTEPAAVPEPTSLALVFAGIMAALLVGRRRVPNHGERL